VKSSRLAVTAFTCRSLGQGDKRRNEMQRLPVLDSSDQLGGLEFDNDVGRKFDRLSVLGRRTEFVGSGRTHGVFIKSVAKAANYAPHYHRAVGVDSYPQNNVSLNLELFGFRRVLRLSMA